MLQDIENLPLEVLIEGKLPSTGEEIHYHDLICVGKYLSHDKVLNLERLLECQPDSYPLHVMLFGHYALMAPGEKTSPKDEVAADYKRVVSWFIANRPDFHFLACQDTVCRETDPDWYQQAKQHWLRHVDAAVPHPEVLNNAYYFFDTNDDLELAEQVALKGRQLSPGNNQWTKRLALVYCKMMYTSEREVRQNAAEKAVEQFESYRNLSGAENGVGIDVMYHLGRAALEAGSLENARECVEELRRSKRNVLQAHVLTGLISLRQGDVPAAHRSLVRAATAYRGTGHLTFALARELLLYGQTGVVLGFLRACTAKCRDYYWGKIADLINAIENGEAPNWPYEWDS